MKNEMSTATAGQTPDEIVENIGRLMSEAEAQLTARTGSVTSEKLTDLRARFAKLQGRAGEFYRNAREKVVAGARATDQTIRTHPYESLAIALGVGVLAGALIRRNGTKA